MGDVKGKTVVTLSVTVDDGEADEARALFERIGAYVATEGRPDVSWRQLPVLEISSHVQRDERRCRWSGTRVTPDWELPGCLNGCPDARVVVLR